MAKANWSGKTGSGSFGQKALFKILRSVDVRFAYIVLYLVIPFSIAFRPKQFRAIYYMQRKRLHRNPIMAFVQTIRNFLLFGKVVLDKFAMFAGNTAQFKVNVSGQDLFSQMLNRECGFITAGAHVGNFEIAGCTLQQYSKKFNFISWGGESEEMISHRLEAFKKVNPDANLITIGDDISYLFDIKSAIDKGETIITSCDRLCGSPKHYDVDFLGEKAPFPLGLFLIATKLKVPVLVVHIFKYRGLRYEGFVKELKYDPSIKSDAEQAKSLVRQYVEILEDSVIKHPLQWFNYYNFWQPVV